MAEALQSSCHHIEWTTCSGLPTPMYDAYVAVFNGTIYCTGITPNEDNQHDVYCYNTKSDQWKQLPRPGHHLGVIHIVDDVLTIFGGMKPHTSNRHNKVTTYNSRTNCWYNYFLNMLHNRYKPGIVTSHDYVIVMGGKNSPDTTLDNIEIMNYHHLQWREVSVHFPVPMWGINPTISGDDIIIVGYYTTANSYSACYHIPTEELIMSFDQSGAVPRPVQWKKFSTAPFFYTATIPFSNPPIIIGGCNRSGDVSTSDVSLYDTQMNSWRRVDSLTSARSNTGVSLINYDTVIAIGGCTKGKSIEAAMASTLTTVEIGKIVPSQQ